MLQFISLLIVAALGAGQAAPVSYELAVKGCGSHDTLVITGEAIEFRAADSGKSHRWLYADLRDIRIENPKKIDLDSYRTRSRWRFGRAKHTSFDVTSGSIGGDASAEYSPTRRAP